MKKLLLAGTALFVLATLGGCGVSTQKQMVNNGQTPLDAESLYTLIADHSLQLTAIDFDAQLYFQANGRMSALSTTGEKDSGKWDITTDNMLCLDFNRWYFSDLKCYSVFAEPSGNTYLFFTGNGARYYTATPMTSIPQGLRENSTKEQKKSYLELRNSKSGNDTPTTDSPEQLSPARAAVAEPSKAEMKHLMITTARNCPACDLSGVDLSQAELIGANLAGANLAGANLSGANLRRADLTGADLRNANLKAANLPGANLSRSNLTNADLTGANLVKANLTGSVTEGLILQDALLEGTTGIKY